METRIVNIRQLVTPIGAGIGHAGGVVVREDVELRIRDGRIAGVEARASEGCTTADVRVIDADGGVVLPGLVDPHAHWSADRSRWAARLRQQAAFGVTTLELKLPAEADEAAMAALVVELSDDRVGPKLVPTLFGSPAGDAKREDRISSLIQEAIPMMRRRRLVVFCDVACGLQGYGIAEARTILRAARGAGLALKVHTTGASDGRAVRLACELEATSVDGLDELDARGIESLRRVGVVPVLLPGSALIDDRPYPDGRSLVKAGLPIALGSDRGSGECELGSIWIAIGLSIRKMGFAVEEAIAATTLHAACALRREDKVGSIEPGKAADLVILDLDDYRDIGRTFGKPPIRAVLVDGRPIRQARE